MGIKIFYVCAALYAVVSGLGLLRRPIPQYWQWVFLGIIAAFSIYYGLSRKASIIRAIIISILVNAAVQLSGGTGSPFFLVYLAALLLVCFKETQTHYWMISTVVVACEVLSAVFNHAIIAAPLIILGGIVVMLGLIRRMQQEREQFLKKSLVKYEARDDFFKPMDIDSQQIVTSISEIDRHPPSERPLLYLVRLIHNTFKAYTTTVFSYYNNCLTLIQGFSQSELFNPRAVIDMRSGIYRQVIASGKPLLIEEFIQNPEELGYYRGEVQISSVIICPIIILNECQGLLVVDRKTDRFSEQDRELISEAATSAALILAMLRRYEEKHGEASHLKYVFDHVQELQRVLDLQQILIEAAHSFIKMMGCNDVSIASVDELNETGEILFSTYIKERVKFSFEDGLVGMIARHKNYIIQEDMSHGNFVVVKKGLRTHNLSFIGLPVLRDDELLGVVWLEDHLKNKFSKDQVNSLRILSSQLSFAWQRALLHEKVKELSQRDGLTGLYNHRYFQETLADEIAKKRELVLLMVDIDHFKKVNDQYGHQAGDQVLEFLGRHIEQTGIAARYGGEEFAIILTKCSLNKGVEKAMKIMAYFRNSEVKINKQKIQITVSIGVAHFPSDAQTREMLIQQADRALYQAKELGRDKVIVAKTISEKNVR